MPDYLKRRAFMFTGLLGSILAFFGFKPKLSADDELNRKMADLQLLYPPGGGLASVAQKPHDDELFLVVAGASIPGMNPNICIRKLGPHELPGHDDGDVLVVDSVPGPSLQIAHRDKAWFAQPPAEYRDGVYPRGSHFAVGFQSIIGTRAEICAHLMASYNAAFDATSRHGDLGKIYGDVRCEAYQAALRALRPEPGKAVALPIDNLQHPKFKEFAEKRAEVLDQQQANAAAAIQKFRADIGPQA